MSKKGFHDINCVEFETLFLMTLNNHAHNHAPMKTKYIRANNSPFVNKEISKAIMVRSRLRNKSLKLKTIESREAYKTIESREAYKTIESREAYKTIESREAYKTIESREAYKTQRNYCLTS